MVKDPQGSLSPAQESLNHKIPLISSNPTIRGLSLVHPQILPALFLPCPSLVTQGWICPFFGVFGVVLALSAPRGAGCKGRGSVVQTCLLRAGNALLITSHICNYL